MASSLSNLIIGAEYLVLSATGLPADIAVTPQKLTATGTVIARGASCIYEPGYTVTYLLEGALTLSVANVVYPLILQSKVIFAQQLPS